MDLKKGERSKKDVCRSPYHLSVLGPLGFLRLPWKQREREEEEEKKSINSKVLHVNRGLPRVRLLEKDGDRAVNEHTQFTNCIP